MSTTLHRTTLHQNHIDNGGKMVEFAGWSMPIHYGSQIKEHEFVRQDAGMFDVSHMCIIDVSGSQAKVWLQELLANNVDNLIAAGQAIYAAMLNENGGVIDDMLVYLMPEGHYRLVVNAGNADKDITWMKEKVNNWDITIDIRRDLSILAVQGPNSITKIGQVRPEWFAGIKSLKPFYGAYFDDCFIARTGYTGEEGVEILIPNEQVESLFNQLKESGVALCGLGARDTLRLEAGMNLYGHEMDELVSPLVANMGWTIGWQPETRNFIGRAALQRERSDGIKMKLVGIVLASRGVLRQGMALNIEGLAEGVITSGTFSPTLGISIAMARVPITTTNQEISVELRGVKTPVKLVKMPFVRHGKKVYQL